MREPAGTAKSQACPQTAVSAAVSVLEVDCGEVEKFVGKWFMVLLVSAASGGEHGLFQARKFQETFGGFRKGYVLQGLLDLERHQVCVPN